MTARPPIIIIGMHRSGTSLVTRLLEQLGLFVGRKKDENNESLFFQELNDWILFQAGAAWDNPQAINSLFQDKEALAFIVEYFRTVLKSPVSRSYFGLWHYLRSRREIGLEGPWGWKDPRNTFTLPLWLGLFPDAKVIHIRRHGVDVAYSLKRRADKWRKTTQDTFQTLGARKRMPPLGARAVESPRCLVLEGSFLLWEEYMAAAGRVTRPGERAREIAYEDVLTNPVPILYDLANFCGLDSPRSVIETVCEEIQPDRAFAYRHDEEQQIFAASVAERLRVFGY